MSDLVAGASGMDLAGHGYVMDDVGCDRECEPSADDWGSEPVVDDGGYEPSGADWEPEYVTDDGSCGRDYGPPVTGWETDSSDEAEMTEEQRAIEEQNIVHPFFSTHIYLQVCRVGTALSIVFYSLWWLVTF